MIHRPELRELIHRLAVYNEWRLGSVVEQPSAKQLTADINLAIEILKEYRALMAEREGAL